jgi:dephospho-CoA kinase
MAEETARLAAAGHDLAFYDTPLLFEVGLDGRVDCVVVVWAPPDVQRARLAVRDGLGPAEADARLAAQLPIDEKAARADFVVENVGTVAELGPKADRLLADLRRGLGRKLPNAAPLRY